MNIFYIFVDDGTNDYDADDCVFDDDSNDCDDYDNGDDNDDYDDQGEDDDDHYIIMLSCRWTINCGEIYL